MWAAEIAPRAKEKRHYLYNLLLKAIELNSAGRTWARNEMKGRDSLSRYSMLELYEAVERAIQVDRDYKRGVHYVVQDDEATIVNEHTGRLGIGRLWMDGLHQAIQAVEDLEITSPQSHAARITVQSLFVSFEHRAGMTGTAISSAREFRRVYKLHSTSVPTHRRSQRRKLPDRFFQTRAEKLADICCEIRRMLRADRAVLVGTRSVARSEELAEMLRDCGIEHQVLNALNHAEEARVVAGAGQSGCVPVATNMAGRGTDILISDKVKERGGLHVILTELHDSPRIDRQLIGRTARQGEPGTYRRYFCMEDQILDYGFGVAQAQRIRNKGIIAGPHLLLKAQARLANRLEGNRKAMLYHDKRRLRSLWQTGFDPLTANVG